MAQNSNFIEENLADISASIQQTIVTILLKKLRKASRQTGIRTVALAGGVSANSGLREALEKYGGKEGWKTFVPRFEYCTDNAAMIGITGYYKFLRSEFCDQDAAPYARGFTS